jgi:hypothetical protein
MNPTNEAEKTEEVDYEAQAREDGWMPSEDWKGDPKRWVDAKTFVERGQQFLPIVQAKYRKTLETVESLRKEVDELKVGSKEYREFAEKAIARERSEKEAKITELETLRKKAISEGDGEAFDRADKKLTELRQEPPAKPSLGPETQAWLNENTWYSEDRTLRGIADGLSDVVAAENPGLKGRAFLDKLREKVQMEVPHKFQNSKRDTVLTEDHQRKSASKKGRTYEDLPDDAKTACSRFLKQIPGFTKEAFLSQYDWSE